MIGSGRVSSDLPELDYRDDPRGGAAGWAVLVASAVLIAGIIALVMWIW